MLRFFGKGLRKLHDVKRDERGFTLIELLVVIIIIGILAAIAIPAFLSQKEKAGDASAKSSLRNAATAQETYRVDHANYALTNLLLQGEGWRPTTDVTLTINGATGATFYCMSAKHTASTSTWWMTSDNGAPTDTKPGTCT